MNFSVSNLFVIMGMNYFKKFDKVIFAVWLSYNRDDYLKYTEKMKEKNPNIITKNVSAKKQLEQYQQKYSFDISSDITKCQQSTTSKSIEKNKESVIKSLPKRIITEDKKAIEKLVIETSNTVYGTLNENGAIKVFEVQQKCKVVGGQAMTCVDIDCGDKNKMTLVGKIDGITDKEEIVEVKNRVKKHFNTLRGYEKPQIMTYMWMNKKKKGFMVENLKTKGGCNINIIPVDYEDDYVEDEVIPQLKKFHTFFLDFMGNEEWKFDLLQGEEAKLYDIFMSNY